MTRRRLAGAELINCQQQKVKGPIQLSSRFTCSVAACSHTAVASARASATSITAAASSHCTKHSLNTSARIPGPTRTASLNEMRQNDADACMSSSTSLLAKSMTAGTQTQKRFPMPHLQLRHLVPQGLQLRADGAVALLLARAAAQVVQRGAWRQAQRL